MTKSRIKVEEEESEIEWEEIIMPILDLEKFMFSPPSTWMGNVRI
ncbi:hypothetical protein NSS74_09575 [Bacillus sp. FSL E2-8868]